MTKYNNEKIGIVGYGFVGEALSYSFDLLNIPIVIYDKFKNIGQLIEILNTKMVFLCLPTLYNDVMLEYDKTSIYEICQYLSNSNYCGIVMIKSTVEPCISQKLSENYSNLKIIHNPEFLSAKTNKTDYHNQNHIIIGKTNSINDDDLNYVESFFSQLYPTANITKCSSTESESVKLFCNCFYASKIQIFTEFYLLCEKIGINYDLIREIMFKNKWINQMHTQVPGHDGQISYGGVCFPKDTNALLQFMKRMDVHYSVLENVISERNLMRNSNS